MKTNKPKPTVLIVDDDKNTRDGLERALMRHYEIYAAESGERALDILNSADIRIMLSDVRMPGMDGLTLLQRALAKNPALICILLTAYGNVDIAVEAMKRGAYDFLSKPVNLDHLELLLSRSLRSMEIETENISLHKQLNDKFGLENIIGNSPVMMHLFETIKQAAPTQATIQIQGESGTGKELVAHAIHRLSTRAKGPFIPVHCAALTPTLLESELFGHEKGSFTGAATQRRGRFEMADGGTLFLDEISEIDESTQVKLLRVLEERQFERVGGDKLINVDIRLVTATNKNLKQLVKDGKFREDLFFRLDVVNITLPPLRERPGDIPLFCNIFLNEFCQNNNKDITGFTPDTINTLSLYNWPGNVRELRNTIEKMVVMARGNKLSTRDIPQNIRDEVGETSANDKTFASSDGVDSLASAERAMILSALKKNKDSRTKAARELGISRRTLHRKLNKYKTDEAL